MMALNALVNSCPKGVRLYSTDGGEVGRTVRSMTLRASSSRNRCESTLADTGGISMRNSLKRRGPSRKCQITFGAQAPAMIDMHSVSTQGIVRITEKRRHWTKNVERLSGTELAPLGEGGGTVQLEIFAAVEVALLIEMIVYG